MPPHDESSVARAYDRLAIIYDMLYGRVLQPGREVLSKTLEVKPGQNILELGVGSGLMLPLYPKHAAVLGLDLSPRMLEQARQRVERMDLSHVELRLADAEQNGLADESFDHVVLPYVYSVTPEPLKLMQEAFRVCRRGGNIWLLNHFSGLGVWDWLAYPLKPFAQWVGFRPDFPFQSYVTDLDMDVQAIHRVNLFGLSRLVHIRRSDKCPPAIFSIDQISSELCESLAETRNQ